MDRESVSGMTKYEFSRARTHSHADIPSLTKGQIEQPPCRDHKGNRRQNFYIHASFVAEDHESEHHQRRDGNQQENQTETEQYDRVFRARAEGYLELNDVGSRDEDHRAVLIHLSGSRGGQPHALELKMVGGL